MSYLRQAGERREPLVGAPAGRRWWTPAADRGERLALAAASRPYAAILAILLLNALLALAFIGLGELLFSDPAEFLRELMPGTWLSFAELLFVAAIAAAIHRQAFGSRRPRLDNFWGLSVVVFIVLAIDEITQFTVFLSSVLTSLGTLAPLGFKDLDAFLLSVLLLAAVAVLLRYARDVLPYPAAIVVFAIGGALGVASQGLDSALASTSSEFVAEESLKLAAEPFIIGGYLLVLYRFLGHVRNPTRSRDRNV
jgi:hypothetical protein